MGEVSLRFGGDSKDAQRAAEAIVRDLEKISRQALATSATMAAALGGVKKEFAGLTRESHVTTTEHERHNTAVGGLVVRFSKLRQAVSDTNRSFALLRNVISAIKWPAIAVAIGYAAQAINALLAGATSLVAVLGSLVGVVAAAPAALVTLVGAVLTATLAFGGLKEALNGNEEAFKKLTPEAKEFVRVLEGLKPVMKGIKQEAQRGLFPGVTEGLQNIFSERNIGIFRKNIRAMGEAMGESFAELGKFLNRGDVAKDLDFILGNAAKNFRVLGHAGVLFADGLRNISVAAQPLTDWLTKLIEKFGSWLSTATKAGRESGGLARFFAETKKTMQELGAILGPLGSGLANVFKAAAPAGHRLLQLLAGASEQMERFTKTTSGKNAMSKYFNDAVGPLVEMGRLLRDLVGVLISVGSTPELSKLIVVLRKELLPTLELVLKTLIGGGFGEALVRLAVQLGRIIALLAGSSGPLVKFIQFLGGVLKVVADLIEKLPFLRSALFVIFGLMAVNKIIPITRGIHALAASFVKLSAAETAAGTSATRMSIMFRAAMTTMKTALISTGIGIALVAIGLAAELVIQHWDKVGPYFKALFTTLVEGAKALAYSMAFWFLFPIRALLKGLSLIPDGIPGISAVGDAAGKALGAIDSAMNKIKPNLGAVKQAWSDIGTATDSAASAAGRYADAVAAAAAEVAGTPLAPVYKGGIGTATGAFQGSPVAGVAPSGLELIGGPGEGTHAQTDWQSRNAVDIKITKFTAIVSPMPGRVVAMGGSDPSLGWHKSGTKLLYGLSITIRGKYGTVFITHLDSYAPRIKVGAYVKAGQPVGFAEKAGHIHYAREGAQTSGQVLGTEGLTAPVPVDTSTSGAGFDLTDPTFDTKGADKPTQADIKVFREEMKDFARGIDRVLDPGIEKRLRAMLAKIRKLLRGPVSADDMKAAQDLFSKMKDVYQSGIDLNPIVRKLDYWDSHMGRFAGMPKVQAAIRAGTKRVRDLIAKFSKPTSEGGIVISAAEAAKIGKAFEGVAKRVQEGLSIKQVQTYLNNWNKMIAGWARQVLGNLTTKTSGEIMAQIDALKERLAANLFTLTPGQREKLTAEIEKLGQDWVSAMTSEAQALESKVADLWSSVLDKGLDAIDRKWDRWLKQRQAAIAASFGVIRGQTAASRALQEFREGRDQAAFDKSVKEAQRQLEEAERKLTKVRSTPGATAEDIAAAEAEVTAARERVYELQLDAKERALQKEADAQEEAYQDALEAAQQQADEQREIERESYRKRLADLEQHFKDVKHTAAEAQAELLALLGEYGIDTELGSATEIFTAALLELGDAIVRLANVLRSIRDMASPSAKSSKQSNDDEPNSSNEPDNKSSNDLPYEQGGGFIPKSSRQIRIGRDHVLAAVQPGELVLNTAQQERIATMINGGGAGPGIVVQINSPLLLGRSLAVADEIASAVGPAINRRIGYRYPR